MNDHELIKGTAAWLARTDPSNLEPELSVADALIAARELLAPLAKGEFSATAFQPDDREILVLRVATHFIAEVDPTLFEMPAELAESLYNLIETANWPMPDYDERAEILAD